MNASAMSIVDSDLCFACDRLRCSDRVSYIQGEPAA
jgi:hypothetical protein